MSNYDEKGYSSNRGSGERLEGRIKWFNEDKGYGFIARNDGGDDVFLHYSEIQKDGYKTIREDQPVEFSVEMGPKGAKAVEVIEL